jgi:hypothetical protein
MNPQSCKAFLDGHAFWMIRKWWKERRLFREQVREEAIRLIELLGGSAYHHARTLQKQAGPAGQFYSAVRREIGRQTGREGVDTGTRYFCKY